MNDRKTFKRISRAVSCGSDGSLSMAAAAKEINIMTYRMIDIVCGYLVIHSAKDDNDLRSVYTCIFPLFMVCCRRRHRAKIAHCKNSPARNRIEFFSNSLNIIK